jgi:hypothetical protein
MRSRAWLWVLGGLVAVLAVVAVVVLVTRDDDSSTASSTTTTSSTRAPGTTTSPPAPSTTPSPVSTTQPLPPVTDDPQSYAEFLFVAWQNADRAAAADVASPEAVDEMFAQPYQPSVTWAFQMCSPAAGSLYCTWNGSNGSTLTMTVRTLTGGLPIQVTMVQLDAG